MLRVFRLRPLVFGSFALLGAAVAACGGGGASSVRRRRREQRRRCGAAPERRADRGAGDVERDAPATLAALYDIAAAQSAGQTLFPFAPLWNPTQQSNATIRADLDAVSTENADPGLPTPCPSTGCTATPSP